MCDIWEQLVRILLECIVTGRNELGQGHRHLSVQWDFEVGDGQAGRQTDRDDRQTPPRTDTPPHQAAPPDINNSSA